jgi:hypothetical protein
MKTFLGDAGTQAAFSYGELTPEYVSAVEQIAPGITQSANLVAWPGESFVDSLSRVVTTLTMADAQRQLLKVQLQRASQGLPPLNSSQYGIGANVNLGVSPEVQTLLKWGGAALLLAIVVPKVLK